MLQYIRSHLTELYPALFLVGFVGVVASMHLRGRKAEDERFQGLENRTVRFRERYVSGRSKKTLVSSIFGADKALEVIVTDTELGIRGVWPIFTAVGGGYDLIHRVPISQVRDLRVEGPKVLFRFPRETGTDAGFTLTLRDPEGFVQAVSAQS